MVEADRREFFVKTILFWGRQHARKFPWREEKNPWRILIAEILLQRTTPGHVLKVYTEFVQRFPDPASLSRASPEEVKRILFPLGMAKRAGMLVRMARVICKRHNGRVPDSAEELIHLPGVGRYTAHGVLCLAHRRPVPMIDVNSARVIRRFFGLSTEKRPKEDEKLWNFAAQLVPPDEPILFNLALLDFGASICRKKPHCASCPLSEKCFYFRSNKFVLQLKRN